jgi:serine/threonine protein kinase
MRTGDVLDGRFEIERLAEKGGMGAVFRARDLLTGQPVALKVLHPGIVRYVQHGTLQDERPYLAMEWLDGEDLRQRGKRQDLRMGETIALGYRVAEALASAHTAGIVHRDIKP